MEPNFTHFDEKGNAIMVDVSEKKDTSRIAVASGIIRVSPEVMEAVVNRTAAKAECMNDER